MSPLADSRCRLGTGWYAPRVALAGAASAGALTALLAAAALSRRRPALQTALRRVLPAGEPPALLGRRLWLLSLAWLAVQETAEDSLVRGGLTMPVLDARQLALILLVSGLCALVAARAFGSSLRLVRRLLARAPAPAVRLQRARSARLPEAPLAWTLVWLVNAAGRRGPPVAARPQPATQRPQGIST